VTFPSGELASQYDWYWVDNKGIIQEYRGAYGMTVADSGALAFSDSSGVALIIAPGDWHDLSREDFDSDG
jgi:hypothetical protein